MPASCYRPGDLITRPYALDAYERHFDDDVNAYRFASMRARSNEHRIAPWTPITILDDLGIGSLRHGYRFVVAVTPTIRTPVYIWLSDA